MDLNTIIATAQGNIQERAAHAVAAQSEQIRELSHAIHSNPELAFVEFEAQRLVANYLESQGFRVEKGVGRLASSLVASYGQGNLVVGICVEYDALPMVGHACGHNLIAGSGLTAAIGLAAIADELDITVKVIGTPAEEHGGGKVYLLQDGAFDDVHCAMMIHTVPQGSDGSLIGTTSQAVGRWQVTYTGRESHAAFAPHQGINAADAVVIAQVALGLLRQQMPGDHRANMVIKEAGEATNIICSNAVVDFEVRAFTMTEFYALYERVLHCFEAGAIATGCTMQVAAVEPAYEPLLHDEVLASHWGKVFGALGRQTTEPAKLAGGSTDFGNISQVIPGIHPWVSISGVTDSIHSPAYAAAADTDIAYETMFEAGIAMAWTIAAVAVDQDAVSYLQQRKQQYQRPNQTTIAGQQQMCDLVEKFQQLNSTR
ncbi:MAG: M20 family metallopeptidase [Propionibacteriaceae bacterium]